MDPDDTLKALGIAQKPRAPLSPEETIAEYKKYVTGERDKHLEQAAKCDAILKYIEEHPDCGMLLHLVKEL